jgi:hypothetical protein
LYRNPKNAFYVQYNSFISLTIFGIIKQTIILPVVLYGCETWSLTLREEHRLRVLENRVLRKIFGYLDRRGMR